MMLIYDIAVACIRWRQLWQNGASSPDTIFCMVRHARLASVVQDGKHAHLADIGLVAAFDKGNVAVVVHGRVVVLPIPNRPNLLVHFRGSGL